MGEVISKTRLNIRTHVEKVSHSYRLLFWDFHFKVILNTIRALRTDGSELDRVSPSLGQLVGLSADGVIYRPAAAV